MPRPTLLRYREYLFILLRLVARLIALMNRVSLSLSQSSSTLTVPSRRARPTQTLPRSSRRVSAPLLNAYRVHELTELHFSQLSQTGTYDLELSLRSTACSRRFTLALLRGVTLAIPRTLGRRSRSSTSKRRRRN